jgi:tRNA U34 2-thiouridine synthase MnmA/TrmU
MKALALLSGGLDSTLAVKLILEQGIDVIALKFTSPFCLCNQKGRCYAVEVAKKFKIPIKVVNKGKDYLRIIKKPKYGYGSGMNPCIDCRIFMLKKAKKYAEKIGAKFIFTGEVLNERPMSQHLRALKIIESEAGLKGKILRPLSAKLLPETEAEIKGWVDRTKLLDIKGRSRKPQIALAEKLGINDYPCPAGGCLLTYKEFARKVKDLFEHKKRIKLKDIELLKIGRHFRFEENKIIIGRNEIENRMLLRLKNKTDYVFEVPNCGSPVAILQGKKDLKAIEITARLTALYSDAKNEKVIVKYGKSLPFRKIVVIPFHREEVDKFRI